MAITKVASSSNAATGTTIPCDQAAITVESGDLVVLVGSVNQAGVNSDFFTSFSKASGTATIGTLSNVINNYGSNTALRMSWCRVTGAGDLRMQLDLNTSKKSCGGVLVLRGAVSTGDPINASNVGTGTSTSANSGTAAVATIGDWLVGGGGWYSNPTGTPSSTPGTWTEDEDRTSTGGAATTRSSIYIEHWETTSTTAYGSTPTLSASQPWRQGVFSVKQAVAITFNAAVTSAASAAGGLTTSITPAAAASATGTAAAAATTSVVFAGAGAGAGTVSALLVTAIAVAASEVAAADAAADLTGLVSLALSAAQPAAASAVVVLTTELPVVAVAAGTSTAFVALTTQIRTEAAAVAVSAVFGNLTTGVAVAGAAAGTAVAAAEVSTSVVTAGSLVASAAAAGDLTGVAPDSILFEAQIQADITPAAELAVYTRWQYLYLTDLPAPVSRGVNSNSKSGSPTAWRAKRLARISRTGAGSSATVTSVNGPTSGIEPGSPAYEWISEPLAVATVISKTVTFNIWAEESNSKANATVGVVVDRLSNDLLASPTAIVDSVYGSELSSKGSTLANWTAVPAAPVALQRGDRLRVRVYFDDDTTMASGYTLTAHYDGTSGSLANSWVQFSEGLSFADARPANMVIKNGPAVSNMYFGSSVALSEDGNTLIVGARGDAVNEGVVYVYTGYNWGTEAAAIQASDGDNNRWFGAQVACSSDAAVIVVSEALEGNEQGQLYVYSGSSWGTETKLATTGLTQLDRLGYNNVSCSGDGGVIVAGVPYYEETGQTNRGAVYVYSGSNWGTLTVLKASDEADSTYFGKWAVVSRDGSTVFVLRGDNKAYAYTGTNWGTETKINPIATPGLWAAVGCNADGSVLWISDTTTECLYKRTGASWATETVLTGYELESWNTKMAVTGAGVVAAAEQKWLYILGDSTRYVDISRSFYAYSWVDSIALSEDGHVVALGHTGEDVNGYTNNGKVSVYGPGSRVFPLDTASDIADQGTTEKKLWTMTY